MPKACDLALPAAIAAALRGDHAGVRLMLSVVPDKDAALVVLVDCVADLLVELRPHVNPGELADLAAAAIAQVQSKAGS